MTLPLSPGGRRYGFRPSLPNALVPRFQFKAGIAIPPSVDLTADLGPVKDQGDLGACTAFAATGYYEYLYRRYKKQSPIFSPLFLYYKERELDGDLGQGDTGSFGSTAVEVLNQFGVCLESTDPYDPANFENAPTDAQVTEALTYRNSPGAYHAMTSVDDMKHCIAGGGTPESQYPVLYGFAVYDSFEQGNWASTSGIMPAPSGNQLGGHENYFKGYNDTIACPDGSTGAFSSRNSWSPTWGLDGDFWMPYSIIEAVLSEARMTHFGKPWG